MKLFLDDTIDPRDVDWIECNSYQLPGWYIIRDGNEFVSLVNELTHENMPHVVSIGNLNGMQGVIVSEVLISHCMKNDINPPIMFTHILDDYQFENITRCWENYLRLYFNKPKKKEL
jgi:hypothetical protein